MDNFTTEEFEKSLKTIAKRFSANAIESFEPKAYLIVGQPGAGKTTIANLLNEQYENNIVIISGDDYRKAHPHYNELQEIYGDKAVLKTQKFAGEMTEALINGLSDKKYNLIIEGTLRNVDVPLKTKDVLENKGYSVELSVMLVRPEISYLSTLKRYHEMKEAGTIPRMTPKEHHDLVVHNIIKNLNKLYVDKAFTNITMYTREKEQIYSLKKTPLVNPSNVMKKEFSRELTRVEKNQIKKEYGKYLKHPRDLEKLLSNGLER